MWLKLVLFVIILSGGVSTLEKSRFCFNASNGTSVCSTVKINNGEALTQLMQSMMAVTVDRKGLPEVAANKYAAWVPAAKGPYSPNRKLDDNTDYKFNFLSGPESMFKVDNVLYAAAANAIYRVDLGSGNFTIIYDGNEKCPPQKHCSRPLGMRIKGNRLLFADAIQGLIEVNLETGESKLHVAVGTPIGGTPLLFPDDIDVDWEEEIVYMSDGSTKWGLDHWVFAVIEVDSSSRVIQFDLKTGKADVFAQNLRFANGIQISHDKKFLLVDEFSARQILKYPLGGSLPVSAKPFTGLLPGNPDNIRPSSTGGYWVALPLARSNGSRNLFDELQARPDLTEKFGNSALTIGNLAESMGSLLSNDPLRHLGHEIKTGQILLDALPRNGMILELDADGRILQSLQSTQIDGLTEVLEHEDGLFCGSFANKFILSVPKANFRNP